MKEYKKVYLIVYYYDYGGVPIAIVDSKPQLLWGDVIEIDENTKVDNFKHESQEIIKEIEKILNNMKKK